MATTAEATVPFPIVRSGQRFYVRMATTCLAVGVIGFAPTYWVPLLRGTLDVAPLTHLHALFFYGWLLLFVRQTALAASGRLTSHRELGVLGVALATGMCFVGLGMTVTSIKRLEAAGAPTDPVRAFAIVSFSAVLLFAALFAVAIVNVKKPEVHKRLMLVATVSMLQAAVGRWFLLFLAPPRPAGGPPIVPPLLVTVLPGLVADLLIVAAMIHDRKTRGRIHPAYWYGGAIVLAVQLLRLPLSTTSGWMHVTDWLIAMFP